VRPWLASAGAVVAGFLVTAVASIARQNASTMSALEGNPEVIWSLWAFPEMTQSSRLLMLQLFDELRSYCFGSAGVECGAHGLSPRGQIVFNFGRHLRVKGCV
jgi:hypothetical protein